MDFAKLRCNASRFVKNILYTYNPSERIALRKLRREGRLLLLKDLIPIFAESSFFALGTGGSVCNLKDSHRLKNRNVLTITMGGIFLPLCYGYTPTLWFLHNEDSALMCIDYIKQNHLIGKIDFSDTHILVPNNFTVLPELAWVRIQIEASAEEVDGGLEVVPIPVATGPALDAHDLAV